MGDHDLESSTVYTAPPFFCRIPPLSLKLESTSPAIAYACRGNQTCILNIELQYRTLPAQISHLDMTEVVAIVPKLNSVRLQGMLIFPVLKDCCPHRLARGIPHYEGVP